MGVLTSDRRYVGAVSVLDPKFSNQASLFARQCLVYKFWQKRSIGLQIDFVPLPFVHGTLVHDINGTRVGECPWTRCVAPRACGRRESDSAVEMVQQVDDLFLVYHLIGEARHSEHGLNAILADHRRLLAHFNRIIAFLMCLLTEPKSVVGFHQALARGEERIPHHRCLSQS
jgi:hypothetical protein